MSMPGWYPDPAGTPGQFRYWDGSQWSSQTTSSPQSGAPQPGATPGPFGDDQRRKSRGPLILVLALVLALALGAYWLIWGRNPSGKAAQEDTHTAAPTVSAWDEKNKTPSATPSPSEPDPSNAQLVACPDVGLTSSMSTGTTLQGGGLVADKLAGWSDDSFTMNGVYDIQSQRLSITSTWVSNIGVGAVHKADGFTDPRRTAQSLMSCIATSWYYRGYTGRKDLVSEQITVSGHSGWHLRTEVHVNNQGSIQGDTCDLVIVDTGSADTLGFFFTAATIGDTKVQAVVDAARAGLRVG